MRSAHAAPRVIHRELTESNKRERKKKRHVYTSRLKALSKSQIPHAGLVFFFFFPPAYTSERHSAAFQKLLHPHSVILLSSLTPSPHPRPPPTVTPTSIGSGKFACSVFTRKREKRERSKGRQEGADAALPSRPRPAAASESAATTGLQEKQQRCTVTPPCANAAGDQMC